MAATFPYLFAQGDWFTTSFIAKRLGIPLRTVQHWCSTGYLIRRGCKVVNFSRGSKTWVYIPVESKDAILSKVPLTVTMSRNATPSL